MVTSKLVATGNTTGNKKLSEAILSTAGQIESLTPQLVNAGSVWFNVNMRPKLNTYKNSRYVIMSVKYP